jgi:hypothetical protein
VQFVVTCMQDPATPILRSEEPSRYRKIISTKSAINLILDFHGLLTHFGYHRATEHFVDFQKPKL